MLLRNDFPHQVFFDAQLAQEELQRQRAADQAWREENRHVADVKVFWNVYKTPVSAPAVEGEAEPVAWRYRDAWGGWAYTNASACFDPLAGPKVITEKQALYATHPAVEAKDAKPRYYAVEEAVRITNAQMGTLREVLAINPAPPAKNVGEWVTVPREPTQGMVDVMVAAGTNVRNIWQAALAASPSPVEAVERLVAKEALSDVLASLVAAVSLLRSVADTQRGPVKAKFAASDRMFRQMLADYDASIERGRAALSVEGK